MIDRALLGAIERALERHEPKEILVRSLISSGYTPQDVDEAIRLVMYRKQQAPQILQVEQEKPEKKPETKISHAKRKHIILIVALSLALLVFIALYIHVRAIQSSCKTLDLPTLKKAVLGISVNCAQVNIIFVETWIAMLTTLALLAIIIYLSVKGKEP